MSAVERFADHPLVQLVAARVEAIEDLLAELQAAEVGEIHFAEVVDRVCIRRPEIFAPGEAAIVLGACLMAKGASPEFAEASVEKFLQDRGLRP
ncbi:MAG: hypothetical protein M3P53_02365 [Actinomycetota bacterium]|nr:hypothetical protein [Actinomycetota bacterium]